MFDCCEECGKRDWRIGYYLSWLFQPIYCGECGKLYWRSSRCNEHILKVHPESMTAMLTQGTPYRGLTPLTLMMKKMSETAKEKGIK